MRPQQRKKAGDDTITLCARISEHLTNIREELAAYRERRRFRHAQLMRDRQDILILILIGCAWAAMLLDKYMPAWLDIAVWAALLAASIPVLVRRFRRKAY